MKSLVGFVLYIMENDCGVGTVHVCLFLVHVC